MLSKGGRKIAEVLGDLGKQICGSLGGNGPQGRVPDSISEPSSASPVFQTQGTDILPGEQGEGYGSPTRSAGDAGERGNREDCRTRSRVLQSSLSSPKEGRVMASSLGCIQVEQIHYQDEIFHGNRAISQGGDRKGRLDDITGHEGCVLSHPYTSSVQEISKVHLQRPGISVQSNVLWTEHCAAGLHESVSTSEQANSSSRLQDPPLFGRLVDISKDERRDDKSHRVYNDTDKRIRNPHKPRKVHFGTDSIYHLPRHEPGYIEFLGFTERETLAWSIANFQKMLILRTNACKVLAQDARPHGRFREICEWCQATHEALPILSQKGLEERIPGIGRFNPISSGSSERSRLVVRPGQNEERCLTRSSDPNFDDVYRRLPAELGSSSRGKDNFRNLVAEGGKRAYQRPGAEGDILCSKRIRTLGEGTKDSSLRGQHNCSILHSEARGDKVMEAFQAGGGAASMDRGKGGNSDSKVHRREEKQGGRHSESKGPGHPHRMDTEQSSVPEHLESVGVSSSRCLRYCPDDEATLLFLPSPRPESSRSGCSAPELEQQGPLCLSPLCSDQKVDKQAKNVSKLQDNFGSSLVAAEGVVPGSSGASHRRSENPPSKERPPAAADVKSSSHRTVRSSADRMEVVLGLTRNKGLSRKVSERIVGARATSTNSLYQVRWSQFAKWCKEKKLSAIRPSVDTICKFFIFLWEERNLSVGTIKGFRSVLHSVLRHNDININHNQDISDVIRSFIIERPVARRDSVAWNMDIVLRYLCSRKFEPLGLVPIRELTKKTLFLVTMALAKRVSEMQAISCDVGFNQEGAVVSLLLNFRAKNDNKVRRLNRNFLVKSLSQLMGREQERQLCPVRALRYYLDRTRNLRGNIKNLFLAPKNTARPASKNGLAYYLKTTVVEAHKEASEETLRVCKVRSQEVRAVSTSLAFTHNLSIDSVIEAAQWRSNSVFASHYLKEVSLQYDNCRSLGPIVAAGTIIS